MKASQKVQVSDILEPSMLSVGSVLFSPFSCNMFTKIASNFMNMDWHRILFHICRVSGFPIAVHPKSGETSISEQMGPQIIPCYNDFVLRRAVGSCVFE